MSTPATSSPIATAASSRQPVLSEHIRRTHASAAVQNRLGVVLLVACIQAAIGYIQYFNDIPALLVGLHIAGATALWSAVVWFYLGLFTRPADMETRRMSISWLKSNSPNCGSWGSSGVPNMVARMFATSVRFC